MAAGSHKTEKNTRTKPKTAAKSASSAKAKTTAAKKKTGRPVKAAEPEPAGFLRGEVTILVSFALAVVLFLSNFHLCGAAGDLLRSLQLGLFGWLGYVFPVLLVAGTCFYQANRGDPAALRKTLASAAAFLVFCSFLQLILGQEPAAGGVFAYFTQSMDSGHGGGLAGGLICMLLRGLLGTAGAFVALSVCFIICAVCITERSFVGAVRKGGDAACQYAKEDLGRRRQIMAGRLQERRLQRAEQVRGVDLNATDLALSAPAQPAAPAREEEAAKAEVSAGFREPVLQAGPDGDYASAVGVNLAAGENQPDEKNLEAGEDRTASKTQEAKGAPAGEAGAAASAAPQAVEAALFYSRKTQEPEDTADEIPFDEDEPPVLLYGQRPVSLYGRAASQEPAEPLPVDVDKETFAETAGEAADEDGEQPGAHASDDRDEWDSLDADWILPPADTIDMEAEPERAEINGETLAGSEEDLSGPAGAADSAGGFSVSNGRLVMDESEKRVVTASGKIIETETELLEKKLEQKRQEARSEQGILPSDRPQDEPPKKEYIFPPLTLLKLERRESSADAEREYRQTAVKLQQTLQSFGVGVKITNISHGPSVTRYELQPDQGVKVSKIVALTDDIKLSLAVADVRIEAPIPGKPAVGIEVPNRENNTVYLRELLESESFQRHKSSLAFAVGKDISGQTVVADIAKMPHLLIAGATGSGKSVCINTLIMSMIYKSKPEDVKLIMVDPKVVELSVYNGIPHLLIPVVTDPKKASGALNWAVAEMTDRYNKFAKYGVRDIRGFNARVEKISDLDDPDKPAKLPQIVIIIDELADLMMVAPGEVEDAICRLAQLARAAGIHLVIATQRPSVNVITGLIKANIPSRIAFSVSSGVDSRTIIDMNGAEKLLGRGDMLFYPTGYPKPQRVQGAFISDAEVQAVVDFLSDQFPQAAYSSEIEERMNQEPAAVAAQAAGGHGSGRDEYFEQAARFIIEKEKASIGMLQRMFKIGFNRAARIMDQLCEIGVVGEEEGTKPRKVLMTMEEFEAWLTQNS